jgi:four helix bundle protein
MAQIETFRDLIVWQKGMDLAEQLYRAARNLVPSERYELGSQLRRAGASIPANVSEGFCRHSRARYRFHIAIALGSQAEVQTHLELARRLALIPETVLDRLDALTSEVGRLLNGLWKSLAPVAVAASVAVQIVLLAFLGAKTLSVTGVF